MPVPRRLLAPALVLGLALGTASMAAAAEPAVGAVTGLKGTVLREQPGGARGPLALGDPVYVTDVIVTESGSKARIQLNSGSIISIGESARLGIGAYQGTENQYATRINPAAGALRVFVNRVLPGGRFEVETETAVAAVRGTDFVVDVTPEKSSVALLDGKVAVRGVAATAGNEVVLSRPGDGTDVPRGGAPSPVSTWGAQRFATTVARASFE
jgi:hypothetical protein